MIHLTIQDVALLANLAGCCNTVEEFAEYLNKTHGWGSTPLSAQSPHDGEFIVSYDSIESIDYKQQQNQFTTEWATIQRLKSDPGSIDIRVSSKIGLDSITHPPGQLASSSIGIGHITSRGGSDFMSAIYAGIYKLKYNIIYF